MDCWPNTGLGLVANAEATGAAENEDTEDPKAGTLPWFDPKAGVCPAPKLELAVLAVKPNGEGFVVGAGAADAGVEAALPNEKLGAEFPTDPKTNVCWAGAAGVSTGGGGWLFCCCPNTKAWEGGASELLF